MKTENKNNKANNSYNIMIIALMLILSSLIIYQITLWQYLTNEVYIYGWIVLLIANFLVMIGMTFNKRDVQQITTRSLNVIVLSLGLFFMYLATLVFSNHFVEKVYRQIDSRIIEQYEGKAPTSDYYARFKKDQANLDRERLHYYIEHETELFEEKSSTTVELIQLLIPMMKNPVSAERLKAIIADNRVTQAEYAEVQSLVRSQVTIDKARGKKP